MGEAFQEETGIIQEHVPVHWSRYNDALKAAVPAGVGPDAFENNWSHISPMASEEFIAPLQDYAVSEWGGGWKDLFVAGLIDELEHLGQIDGSNNIYSIPIRGQAIGQYYANLDLFKEHDLDCPLPGTNSSRSTTPSWPPECLPLPWARRTPGGQTPTGR